MNDELRRALESPEMPGPGYDAQTRAHDRHDVGGDTFALVIDPWEAELLEVLVWIAKDTAESEARSQDARKMYTLIERIRFIRRQYERTR